MVVLDIILNIALLLSISIIFATFPLRKISFTKRSQYLMGLVIGVIGVLLINRAVIITEGIVFDGRSILLGVSAMFFGPIPAIIGNLIVVVYRLILGGGGVWTGITSPTIATVVGLLWNRWRYKAFREKKNNQTWELYIVGLIVHFGFALSLLLLPAGQLKMTSTYFVPIIIAIYPVGFYLLALLLNFQLQQIIITQNLEQSRKWFKTLFEQAPMGITVTDSTTSEVIDVNNKYLEIIGRSKEELETLSWRDLSHPEDLVIDDTYMKQLVAGEISSYSMDKRFLQQDGSYIWVKMEISRLHTPKGKGIQHLCMIVDITKNKEFERAILYANTHDPLTGLYNRTKFDHLLQQLNIKKNYPLAIVIADVNGLKIVNDAFGQEEGDSLLIEVAQKLLESVKERGFCARIGGDEFALILPKCSESEAWQLVVELQKAHTFVVQNVELTVSFGVAVQTEKEVSLNTIIKHAENSMNKSKISESPSTRSKAIHTIINTLNEKNRREELHSRRVSLLSVRLAEAIGMSGKEALELKTIGLLHDIGKIAVDEAILNKSGPLDKEEWDAIRRHPETGWRILSTVGELGEYANVVLTHHERIDGKGYPQGLKGEEIPYQARVIAIADAYDAMTALRPYRESVSDQEAAKELKRCSGSQFDEKLARVFVEQVLQFEWDSL